MADEKLDLLKGTLDLLVLQILSSMGPLHGYGVARRLEQVSGDQLAMNEGTITRRSCGCSTGGSSGPPGASPRTTGGRNDVLADPRRREIPHSGGGQLGRLASVIGRVLTTSKGGVA